jgi:hypothetical protein
MVITVSASAVVRAFDHTDRWAAVAVHRRGFHTQWWQDSEEFTHGALLHAGIVVRMVVPAAWPAMELESYGSACAADVDLVLRSSHWASRGQHVDALGLVVDLHANMTEGFNSARNTRCRQTAGHGR